MLSEIYIRNFAIIDDLRVQFDFGFNVLTGETGAGKSILLDSVGMLLGERADTTMVRAGCETAILEATFELTTELQTSLFALIEEHGLEGDEPDMLLVGREIRANGRSICRVNGRTVPLSVLRDICDNLVDIHGQGEHLSLLQPGSHLPLLDAYGQLDRERRQVAVEVGRLRELRAELAQLRASARHVAQRIDFLNFQVEEISAARLEPGEESDLRSERARLGNVEQLLTDAAEAMDLLEGSGEESLAVIDLLGQAERAISRLARLDPTQAPLLETLQGVTFQLSDLSATLRDYQETLEFNPERLDEVEERLELINRLKRKYGDDIPAILETLRKAEEELDGISHSEERQKLLEKQEHEFLVRIGEMAAALSQKRKAAAEQMAAAVVVELDELRMAGTRFAVDFHVVENEDGAFIDGKRLAFDSSGVDRAEFLISANPGEPLKPMAKVASGGETARLMLALKTVLAQVDKTPTLIFDEIDQGIGGRVGITVGEKLWGLTQHGGHQVIVVTHLPQMAGFGDVHMQVSKAVDEGRTVTLVNTLDEAGRIEELAAMLGTREDEARRGAASILHQANEKKKLPVGV